MGKPFFSVIIPTFNSAPYIERLLDSIVAQNDPDCEVVVCDDYSTDNIEQLVRGYEDRLKIVFFKRPGGYREHCPGNTRREGQKKAKGEWITFVDHDDELAPDAFKNVREILNDPEHPEKQMLICGSFIQVQEDGTEKSPEEGITWLHGRFYRKSFLEKYGIEFKPDLKANEDLYFNTLVQGALAGNDLPYVVLNKVLYRWHARGESFSHQLSEDGKRDYLERFFGDYVFAVTEGWFEGLEKYPKKIEYFQQRLLSSLLYCYFYYQAFLFKHGDDQLPQNMLYIGDFYKRLCQVFSCRANDIIMWGYQNPKVYNEVRRSAIVSSVGEIIEANSFIDFVKILAIM